MTTMIRKSSPGDRRGVAEVVRAEALLVEVEADVWNCRSEPPVELPCRPNISGSAKIWKPPIVEMMTVKMIVGRSSGTVIDQNCCHCAGAVDGGGLVEVAGMACMAAR